MFPVRLVARRGPELHNGAHFRSGLYVEAGHKDTTLTLSSVNKAVGDVSIPATVRISDATGYTYLNSS
jgi:hypothetical protein